MSRPLRLAVLWSELTGYLNACLKALVDKHGVELDVTRIRHEGTSPSPFEEKMFGWISRLRTVREDSASAAGLEKELRAFGPDVIVVGGWVYPIFRHIAVSFRKRSVYVIGTADNPWQGTWRQRAGALVSPWYVRPLFDALWVPGERGFAFARRLGFARNQILFGLYSANLPKFAEIAKRRSALRNETWPRRFFFAGRLEEVKGIADLAAAYRNYSRSNSDPWELWVAGNGALHHLLARVPGVKMLGFVQPDDYPAVLDQVGAFILPSRYDPWPLVIHEMTSAGLPILCSRQCGSSVELVQDGLNGFTFEAGDVSGISQLMTHVSSGAVDLEEMARNSSQLSLRYSPEKWADYLMGHLQRVNKYSSESRTTTGPEAI